jgi:hypothetical protein
MAAAGAHPNVDIVRGVSGAGARPFIKDVVSLSVAVQVRANEANCLGLYLRMSRVYRAGLCKFADQLRANVGGKISIRHSLLRVSVEAVRGSAADSGRK